MPPSPLNGRYAWAFRDGQEDLAPSPGLRTVGDAQVTVMPWQPADRDQVAGHIKTALRPEDDVVQSRVLHPTSADPAAAGVAIEDMLPNARWHQAQLLELKL